MLQNIIAHYFPPNTTEISQLNIFWKPSLPESLSIKIKIILRRYHALIFILPDESDLQTIF